MAEHPDHSGIAASKDALGDYMLRQLERRITKLEDEAVEREKARNDLDKKNLMRGIVFLGAVVTTLAGLVWHNLSIIIGGRWPHTLIP